MKRLILTALIVGLFHPLHAVQAIESGALGAALNRSKTCFDVSEGFEGLSPGRFEELETPFGLWQVLSGEAAVDNRHAKSGSQCLHLLGGTKTQLVLQLVDSVNDDSELTFWAERWTKRDPFTFRIEKNEGDGWKEILNGDQKVVVGREFRSFVKVPLADSTIERLRLTVSSPPNTGILLDDFRIAPARPQRVVKVESESLTTPALVGLQASPLLKVKLVTVGSLDPISLTDVQTMLLAGRDEIDSLQVLLGPPQTTTKLAKPLGDSIPITDETDLESKIRFHGSQLLHEGENVIWVAARLKPDANLDGSIGARLSKIQFSNGQTFELDIESSQRIGIALRQSGDDDAHTYRIPGLATTNSGTLIGVYDVRYRSGRDLPGDIDVGMSRSTDGGKTWDEMKIIMDMGRDPKWQFDGSGDPAILVDQTTGTIWVAATWSHGNRSWNGSGPGLLPHETGQLMLVRSDDDGITWSKPINITEQVKNPDWSFILQGPGKGITMKDGTLVFAAQYQDPPDASNPRTNRLPHSTIIYSKDHGNSWSVGTAAFDDTTEAQVVEVEPGVLMLNCRYNRASTRVVMTTSDLGKTWHKHSTSESSLIEPRACMGSLIRIEQDNSNDNSNILLFSNPNDPARRQKLTIKASFDHGASWPREHQLLLDQPPSRGYSCMSMIDQQTIGILYEGSQSELVFQRIKLRSLIGDKEPTQQTR